MRRSGGYGGEEEPGIGCSGCTNTVSGIRMARITVESRAGAPTIGSGGYSVAFAPGLRPAPVVTFPAPARRTRRAALPLCGIQHNGNYVAVPVMLRAGRIVLLDMRMHHMAAT